MSIFARRRLQKMLQSILHYAGSGKTKEIFSRLENKDTKTALAAEIELALLWALSEVSTIEVEPLLESGRRPDVFSSDVYEGRNTFIEITAVSDDEFSGSIVMDRAANIISEYARQIRKDCAEYLFFTFGEEGGFKNGKYIRRRKITREFQLTEPLKEKLRAWLSAGDWPNPPSIRLTDDRIDVVVERKSYVTGRFRTHSSMPPLAYDIERNPVFKALKRKGEQLSKVSDHSLRWIFLGDAGCNLLRDLNPIMKSAYGELSGNQIIHHYLSKSRIDMVCVFSATHSNYPTQQWHKKFWQITIFDRRPEFDMQEYEKLERLARLLPRPHYAAYQARALHKQGVFDPQRRGNYLGSSFSTRGLGMPLTVKFSARLLQEFLAGRITKEQFQRQSFDVDFFENCLKSGQTIQAARIESAGIDEDDDYIVLEMNHDWAAKPLELPK
jgi:hypothetical protein